MADIELSAEERGRYVGEVEMESGRNVSIGSSDGTLTIDYGLGTYRLFPESDTGFAWRIFRILCSSRAGPRRTGQRRLFGTAGVPGSRERGAAGLPRSRCELGDEGRRGLPRITRGPTLDLARALSGTGRAAEALDHLRMALSLDPGYDDAERLLIRLRIRRYAWLVGALALALAWWLSGGCGN